MIQTETSKAKIIFVSVPDNTEKSKIHHYKGKDILWHITKAVHKLNTPIDLPEGNWTILNVLDDVTEDEAMGILGVENSHSLATSLGVEGKTIIIYELK